MNMLAAALPRIKDFRLPLSAFTRIQKDFCTQRKKIVISFVFMLHFFFSWRGFCGNACVGANERTNELVDLARNTSEGFEWKKSHFIKYLTFRSEGSIHSHTRTFVTFNMQNIQDFYNLEINVTFEAQHCVLTSILPCPTENELEVHLFRKLCS